MSCSSCIHGLNNYGGQIKCQCVNSDNFDKLMDANDICRYHKIKKVMKEKEIDIPETINHIEVNVDSYNFKKEEEKKIPKITKADKPVTKNYKVKNGTKRNIIYVIVCDDHIANFGDSTYGGRHIYFHEEYKAQKFCQVKSTPYIKYKYIECIIKNEL